MPSEVNIRDGVARFGNQSVRYDNDYYEGFRQGLRAICGKEAPLPVLSELPARSLDRTPFQIGLIRGIEHAKGWREGSLLLPVQSSS